MHLIVIYIKKLKEEIKDKNIELDEIKKSKNQNENRYSEEDKKSKEEIDGLKKELDKTKSDLLKALLDKDNVRIKFIIFFHE